MALKRPKAKSRRTQQDNRAGNIRMSRIEIAFKINDFMDTQVVHAVLETGVSRNPIKKALTKRLIQTGQPFTTSDALLESIRENDNGTETDYDSDSELESEWNWTALETECSPGPSKPKQKPRPVKRKSNHCCFGKKEEPKDILMCKICFSHPLEVLILPCRHLLACVHCLTSIASCAI